MCMFKKETMIDQNKNPRVYPPEIDEEYGEVLCDVCKGTGSLPSKIQPDTVASICWKCQGDGKLDWVSFITGNAPKMYKFSVDEDALYTGMNIHNDVVDAMAYNIANTIDKEIMDNILNAPNKYIKNHDHKGA